MSGQIPIGEVKAGDFLQVPGVYFNPGRHGTFCSTVKSIEKGDRAYRLTLMGDRVTRWLGNNAQFQRATTDLDYLSKPAPREKAKSIRGVTID